MTEWISQCATASLIPKTGANTILVHTGDYISESCPIKPKFDCTYTFPINSVPNGISFDVPHQSQKCNYNPYLV